MAKSVLAAIHGALHVEAGNLAQDGLEPGADAPEIQENNSMPNEKDKPAAGVSQADHEAAVATAERSGREAGATAERERLTTVLGAEGIKGDGTRMAAALDLAVKSPAMSAADLTAFVTANVQASTKPGNEQPSTYEQNRVLGAGLAAPEGQRGQEKSGLTKSMDAQISRMKRD